MEAICKQCGAVYGFKGKMPETLECFSCESHEFEIEEA